MRKLFNHLTHGGQTWLHHVRMTGQVLSKVGKWLFLLWLILTLLLGWLLNGSNTLINTFNTGLAYLLTYLGMGFTKFSVSYQDGQGYETAKAIVHDPYYSTLIKQSLWCWSLAVLLAMSISIVLYWLISRYFRHRGKQLTEDTFIRGTQLVAPQVLAKQVRRQLGASDIKLDKQPLPKDFEVGHIFIHGTTGAGKSQAIMKLLTAIRKRGDKVIIPDAGGVITRYFYRENSDCLLSPLDARGVDWQLWSEGDAYESYYNMAQSLIPTASRDDPFWTNAARSLFAHALDKMKKDKDRSHSKLLTLLLQTPLDQLGKYFSDTDASMIANKDIEKTTTCVRTLIATYLKSLRLLDKRAESIQYGVMTRQTVPSEYAIQCDLKQADTSKSLTGCLVWIKPEDNITEGRLYYFRQSQLYYAPLPASEISHMIVTIKKSADRSNTMQPLEALLRGSNAKQRVVIEQLHQLTQTTSPFSERFSIQTWIANDEDKRWLFMPYASHQRHAMRPLLSLWLDLACINLLRRKEHPDQKVWIILDELPTLHRLPSLDSMAEGRKFGGCFVLGVQSISQMWELYGSNTTRTLFNLSNTRLFFRSNDSDIARWSSQALGQQTLKRCQQNYSYGANDVQDGVSVNHQRINQATVTAAEIQSLKNLDYYLYLSGNLPITKNTLSYKTHRVIAESFSDITITSQDDDLDDTINQYTQQYPLPHSNDVPEQVTQNIRATEKSAHTTHENRASSEQVTKTEGTVTDASQHTPQIEQDF